MPNSYWSTPKHLERGRYRARWWGWGGPPKPIWLVSNLGGLCVVKVEGGFMVFEESYFKRCYESYPDPFLDISYVLQPVPLRGPANFLVPNHV